MEEESSSQLHKERNKILVKFADHSFSSALDEINSELDAEKKLILEIQKKIEYSKSKGFTKGIFGKGKIIRNCIMQS